MRIRTHSYVSHRIDIVTILTIDVALVHGLLLPPTSVHDYQNGQSRILFRFRNGMSQRARRESMYTAQSCCLLKTDSCPAVLMRVRIYLDQENASHRRFPMLDFSEMDTRIRL